MSTKDLSSFHQIFTKLFDEINLVDMLYEYYYCSWSVVRRNILKINFDIRLNSIILSDKDFQLAKNIEDNKCYLRFHDGGFLFVKKIQGGYKLYCADHYNRNFETYEFSDANYRKFLEIPLDLYSTISHKLT